MSTEAPISEPVSSRPRFHLLHDRVFAFDRVHSGMLTLGLGMFIAVLTLGVLWMTNLAVKPAKEPDAPPGALVHVGKSPVDGRKSDNPDVGELPAELPNREETVVEPVAADLSKDLLKLIEKTDQSRPPGEGSLGDKPVGPAVDDVRGDPSHEQRWVVEYGSESPAAYRKKLDFFGIQVAAFIPGGRILAAVNASTTPKQVKSPLDWFFFQPKDADRIAADTEILKLAGVQLAPGAIVIQYYPPTLEAQLLKIEKEAAGRPVKEIKKTVFGIRRSGDGYEFFVQSQTFN